MLIAAIRNPFCATRIIQTFYPLWLAPEEKKKQLNELANAASDYQTEPSPPVAVTQSNSGKAAISRAFDTLTRAASTTNVSFLPSNQTK